MAGGKQEVDIRGMGKHAGRMELLKRYGGHKAAKPAEKTMPNKKIPLTCLFLKM